MRSARILTCAADSSPQTSSAGRPAATLSSTCSRSVDLPMPGSPPTSTSEPGTMPPPSTRSSSSMPLENRSVADETTSDRRTGPVAVPPPAPSPLFAPRPRRLGAAATTSSTNESQAPQSGQWPSHLASRRPHSPQVKTVCVFATSAAPAAARVRRRHGPLRRPRTRRRRRDLRPRRRTAALTGRRPARPARRGRPWAARRCRRRPRR